MLQVAEHWTQAENIFLRGETLQKQAAKIQANQRKSADTQRSHFNGLKLNTRFLSCYCDNCFDGQYDDCENREWVEPWQVIEIEQERSERRVTRSDSEGQQVGIKDLIAENSIVAIASGDPGEDYYLMKVTKHRPEEL